ncbi:MAG: hypothetical protein WCI89_01420 [bacterium]
MKRGRVFIGGPETPYWLIYTATNLQELETQLSAVAKELEPGGEFQGIAVNPGNYPNRASSANIWGCWPIERDYQEDGDLYLLTAHNPETEATRTEARYYFSGSVLTDTLKLCGFLEISFGVIEEATPQGTLCFVRARKATG